MSKGIFILSLIVLFTISAKSQTNKIVNDSAVIVKSVESESICAFIPDVFTPNRDGINDEWTIKTSGADKCFLTVKKSGYSAIFNNKEYSIHHSGVTRLWDNGVGSNDPERSIGEYPYYINLKNTATGEEKYFEGIVSIRL